VLPKKIKVIVNPNAGGGQGRQCFPLLREKLLERRIPFHLQFSESAEHVTLLARQAQTEGYNIIVTCGGDGTAHRALQAMVGSHAVLGFVPLGRGNDLPRNLGIPEDLESACSLLSRGQVRRIDLIQVNEDLYMAGVGGIGFDAEVNVIANRLNRYLSGKATYILPLLLKTLTYRPKKIALQLDRDYLKGLILMVAFGNIRSYGRGMQITPLAEPDDGLLDVCWIDPVKKLRLYRFFPTVYSGEHLDKPEVHYYRTSTVQAKSTTPLDLYGDGEFLCKTPFNLRVLPRSLRVLVP